LVINVRGFESLNDEDYGGWQQCTMNIVQSVDKYYLAMYTVVLQVVTIVLNVIKMVFGVNNVDILVSCGIIYYIK